MFLKAKIVLFIFTVPFFGISAANATPDKCTAYMLWLGNSPTQAQKYFESLWRQAHAENHEEFAQAHQEAPEHFQNFEGSLYANISISSSMADPVMLPPYKDIKPLINDGAVITTPAKALPDKMSMGLQPYYPQFRQSFQISKLRLKNGLQFNYRFEPDFFEFPLSEVGTNIPVALTPITVRPPDIHPKDDEKILLKKIKLHESQKMSQLIWLQMAMEASNLDIAPLTLGVSESGGKEYLIQEIISGEMLFNGFGHSSLDFKKFEDFLNKVEKSLNWPGLRKSIDRANLDQKLMMAMIISPLALPLFHSKDGRLLMIIDYTNAGLVPSGDDLFGGYTVPHVAAIPGRVELADFNAINGRGTITRYRQLLNYKPELREAYLDYLKAENNPAWLSLMRFTIQFGAKNPIGLRVNSQLSPYFKKNGF